MFNFVSRWRLELKHHMEIRRLRKQRDIELRDIRQKKQFEINKTDLEREIELEDLKSEIRKNQQKSLPKPGQQVPEKKTAFAAFQDFCDDFSKQQSNIGGINGRKRKKGNKRSRTRIGPGFL